jgi:O-methyltransferase
VTRLTSRIASFLFAIGHLYGAPQSFIAKSALLLHIIRNRFFLVSATGFVEQLAMISAILRLSPAQKGSVVECGCYMGGATSNLSLAARLVGRRLYVFDSFEGLPEPKSEDARHLAMNVREYHSYTKGSWCGPFDAVRNNVAKYGALDVCTFVKGYFESTLPAFSEPVVLAFCDVDLCESLETCLRFLWPLICVNGLLFTHEAHHLEIASMFYDRAFWNGTPPGLVGAGSGLGLSPMPDGSFGSCIGYAIKSPAVSVESVELGKRERFKTHMASA